MDKNNFEKIRNKLEFSIRPYSEADWEFINDHLITGTFTIEEVADDWYEVHDINEQPDYMPDVIGDLKIQYKKENEDFQVIEINKKDADLLEKYGGVTKESSILFIKTSINLKFLNYKKYEKTVINRYIFTIIDFANEALSHEMYPNFILFGIDYIINNNRFMGKELKTIAEGVGNLKNRIKKGSYEVVKNQQVSSAPSFAQAGLLLKRSGPLKIGLQKNG